MKSKEIREKSAEELNQKLFVLKADLFNLRYQAKTGRLEKPSQIRNTRRDIARINTIIRERQIDAAQKKQ